ncbi:MAG TPA: hypothetical protein P5330_07255, partial [Candidatus Competibacteraceae bacterium]|nr:hypothetical protein [Candidatus Competibacteraceae bacterium]
SSGLKIRVSMVRFRPWPPDESTPCHNLGKAFFFGCAGICVKEARARNALDVFSQVVCTEVGIPQDHF